MLKSLDLEIAEKLFKRQPYNVIARELRASPKTISKVRKMVEEGIVRISENGQASYAEGPRSTMSGVIPSELWLEVLGASHLEGKSPEDTLRTLVDLHRVLVVKGLNLDALERLSQFLEKAYSRGWKADWLLSIIAKLWNSGFTHLDQQSLKCLSDLLAEMKSSGLTSEGFIEAFRKKRGEWENDIKKAYDLGLKDGSQAFESAILKSIENVVKDYGKRDWFYEIVRIAEMQALLDAN